MAMFVAGGFSSVRAESFTKGFSIGFEEAGEVDDQDNVDVSTPGFGGAASEFSVQISPLPKNWMTGAAHVALPETATGPWAGFQPSTELKWHEVAALVYWLNTSMGRRLTFRLGEAHLEFSRPSSGSTARARVYYFLPSDEDWCKAAYESNMAVTDAFWQASQLKPVTFNSLEKAAVYESLETTLSVSSVADANYWKRGTAE